MIVRLFISTVAAFITFYIGSLWKVAIFGSNNYYVLFIPIDSWKLEQLNSFLVTIIPVSIFLCYLFLPFVMKKNYRMRNFFLLISILLVIMLLPSAFAIRKDPIIALLDWSSDSPASNISFDNAIYAITFILCGFIFLLGYFQIRLMKKQLK